MSTQTQWNASRRLVGAVSSLLMGLFMVSMASPVTAQGGPSADSPWQAWLGCWKLAGPEVRVLGVTTQSQAVCVLPTSRPSAVDIATVQGDKVVDTRRIDADGVQHPSTRDGCIGWESAQWAAGRRHAFVRSEYRCEGGLTRTSSGVLAITGTGDWIDVQGISSGGNKGVRVVRYIDASGDRTFPAEITDRLRNTDTRVSAARIAAATPLSIAAVVEASRQLDVTVADAWLAEFNWGAQMKPQTLRAADLLELADAGVPSSTIDVVVALAYPQKFALNPATRESEVREISGGITTGEMGNPSSMAVVGYDVYGFPIYASDGFMRTGCSAYGGYGYSPYSFSNLGCSSYCMGYYGLSSPGCSPYGFSPYGLGYGYGYGNGYGWYPGGQPVVVVTSGPPTVNGPPPHGHATNGHGYTQGGSSTSATPRAASPSGSSGSTSASASPGSGTSSSGGGGSSRTAVPKKP